MGGRILTGEINCSDIKVTTGLEVEGRTNHATVTEGTKDLDITINRKEYNIIGDEIYIPKLYDDAPQWLKDLVDVVVEVGVEANNADLLGQVQDLINQLANATVPLNTFTQSIIALNLEDARINTVVETLNSNFSDATSSINAQIIDVRNTFVSKDEAAATIANVISAEIDNGVLQNMATVGHVATALATETDARAADYTALESSIAGESEATATAINTINTYVGIDQAGASTGTGLSAYLEASDGTIGGADSELANTIRVTAEEVESKFEYNSILNMNGTYYKSGFGLVTNATQGSGTEANPYNSEFWIDASKLKFTNSNKTGQASPFTIDASGAQPKVTFNGLVTFGSGQTGTIDEAIASTIETVQVGDKNINITDNLIPTTSLVSDSNNAGYQFIGTPAKSMSVGIDTFSEAQIVLSSTDEVYSPYVDEITYPYYFRFGIKGITSLDRFKVVTVNASNVVTYNTVTVTMLNGNTISSTNWYVVDGIINPTGGSTTASGAIRTSDGTKVGQINNFVMPSGTSKLLLGWIANCTISRMKLAKITADTITADYASKDYVSTSVLSSGYVLPSEVANAVNTNSTTINGSKITTGSIGAAQIAAGSITSDRISTYNLTASNATIQNGLITNAKIADASITAAKIVDGNITNAKIGDAQITTAKIGNLSVDTFKIQNEAVTVPRYASTSNSFATIYYTPNVTHTCVLISSQTQQLNGNYPHHIYLNGSVVAVGTSAVLMVNVTLTQGVTYTIQSKSGGDEFSYKPVQLLVLGVKK